MPFRIESLLRNDSSGVSRKKSEKKAEDERVENAQEGSILQQTLLNRLQPPYYRPIGDSFQPYTCDRLYYPSQFYNPYVANDYSFAYGRKYYSIYSSPSHPIFPGPYNVYSKRKGGQVRFTPNQTDTLEKRFMSNQYLSPEERKRLADNLKLSDRQVKTWFQNRRAKWRRSTSSSGSETTNGNENINGHQSKILSNIVTGQ